MNQWLDSCSAIRTAKSDGWFWVNLRDFPTTAMLAAADIIEAAILKTLDILFTLCSIGEPVGGGHD
jgi:hypothetical protein